RPEVRTLAEAPGFEPGWGDAPTALAVRRLRPLGQASPVGDRAGTAYTFGRAEPAPTPSVRCALPLPVGRRGDHVSERGSDSDVRGERDERRQRVRVGESVATDGAVGIGAGEDLLDRSLALLAVERARHVGDLNEPVGHVSR